ncbi:hypothetical protein ACFWJO_40340, partial [Streptomyces sp. NPDC127092]
MSADRPFRFTHRWAVPADARSVLTLLADPAGYPHWWPAVPRARRLGPDRAAVRLRGFVPVRLTMERLIDDRARGLLLARLSGDLTGTVRVTVHDDGAPAAEPDRDADGWVQPPPPASTVRLRLRAEHGWADLIGASRCRALTRAEAADVVAGLGPDPLN